MFVHGKTKKTYYSIKEKIKYYKGVINGTIKSDVKTKRKAKARLKSLTKLDSRSFNEPTLIITNDNHFGNSISKPRLSIVIDKDNKGRLLSIGTEHAISKSIILDKNNTFQTSNSKAWIDKSEIYETKYISGINGLTKYDIAKLSKLRKRK